jgi:4-methyl-5(b-hydroxyethyl)-thiazole monophosphate biosynthesis
MANVVMLLARGFEETEAIVPADLLKRAGANVTLVATEGGLAVPGAHDITVAADIMIEDLRKEEMDCLVIPGGALGTELLGENPQVTSLIEYAANKGIIIAAICAAPSILGNLGLLEG